MKLFHFSETPDITYVEPRITKMNTDEKAYVWGIDEEHAPHYYFPRDCPRIAYWPALETSIEDRERFFSQTFAERIIAVESSWLKNIRETKLYVYELPSHTFECIDENAGYYVSSAAVVPLSVKPVGDLLYSLAKSNVELRITPSLWRLREAILNSTVGFSMIRLRNASKQLK
ncbi:DUF6886 family protein [Bacillus sp. 165]|uniref:DUF6886 family protein n=1 Tax=Bacillus sp. 165 TaxID=1529117 RepID=UPI001ADCF4AB|nr:DUF6886 family protein [Bacillus sp. 165]MBO9128603.1 hypothetical protein [Bacillus sp. 165]